MPCNLNFNQCNGGCQYPQPVFNCRCRLLSILNSSNLTVVYPQLASQQFFNNGFVVDNII